MNYEDMAITKFHKRGKCPLSVFADGGHRAAKVPYYSLVDGGYPGVVLKTVCLECGKEWTKPGQGFFHVRQPNALGGAR